MGATFQVFMGLGLGLPSAHAAHVSRALNDPLCYSPRLEAGPARVVIAIEGNASYAPARAAQLKGRQPTPKEEAVQSRNLAGPVLLDGLIEEVVNTLPDTVWFYFSQDEWFDHGVSRAIACALRVARRQYTLEDGQKAYSTLTLLGFSHGSTVALMVAEALARQDIWVDLGFTVDPVPRGLGLLRSLLTAGASNRGDLRPPTHFGRWINFYQRKDSTSLIPGIGIKGNPLIGPGIENHELKKILRLHEVRALGWDAKSETEKYEFRWAKESIPVRHPDMCSDYRLQDYLRSTLMFLPVSRPNYSAPVQPTAEVRPAEPLG